MFNTEDKVLQGIIKTQNLQTTTIKELTARLLTLEMKGGVER